MFLLADEGRLEWVENIFEIYFAVESAITRDAYEFEKKINKNFIKVLKELWVNY